MLVRALAENGDEVASDYQRRGVRDLQARRGSEARAGDRPRQNPSFALDVFGLVAMGCVVQVGENGPTMTSAFHSRRNRAHVEVGTEEAASTRSTGGS